MSLAAPGTNPASNLELKLPHTIGSANQLLKVDGNGQLGWATDSTTDSTKLPLAGGTLTGDATFSGGSGAITLSANSDIRLTTGSWTGDYGAKIQHHDNYLFLQGGSNGVNLRNAAGTRQLTMTSDGHFGPANSQSYNLGSASLPWNNIHAKDFLILDGGSSHSHPYIQFHSNTTNVRKYRIMNGQGWNPDALLIYDIDADNTRLTIEPSGLGINRGANSLSHCLDVGGTAMIRGNTQIDGDLGLGIAAVPQDSGAKTLHIHHPTVGNPARAGLRLTTGTSGSAVSNGGFLGLDYSNQLYLYNQENGDLRVGTNGTERFRITNNGDVGINTTSPVRKLEVNGTARVSGAFEAYPSSTSAISAGTFYNNSTGASADCRVQIKTYANQGADPYLHFDAGGSNFICGMKYEGTTQNKFMIGPGDSPNSGMTGGIYVHGNGRVSINSSGIPSRRFNISDTGAVQIWTYGNCGAYFSAQYQSNTNSGTQYYNVFTRLDGSWDGYLVSSTDGQITLANNSDYRLKDNVVSMTNGIDIVKKLNPITYKWKASTGRDTSVTMQGFFAHEVDEAGVLGAVDGVKDGVWETAENPEDAAIGDPRIQGLSLERLVPALTAALKEAITKIETLETKVAALEAG